MTSGIAGTFKTSYRSQCRSRSRSRYRSTSLLVVEDSALHPRSACCRNINVRRQRLKIRSIITSGLSGSCSLGGLGYRTCPIVPRRLPSFLSRKRGHARGSSIACGVLFEHGTTAGGPRTRTFTGSGDSSSFTTRSIPRRWERQRSRHSYRGLRPRGA